MATPFERLEGKYEILDKIREGGMGSVYKVRHRLLEEIRVVKVMRPHLADDEILKARFLREAKVAIKLRHANLAQIYDFTMDESGYAYLVMEFIDGFNLQEMVKVLKPVPLGLVLEVARQSLNALGYLHRKKIIHRDVSPDNLLVTRDEDGDLQVKLIDLGIAKVHHEGDDSLTSAGTFLGKVRYSSPEHFKTQEGAEVSAVSDLYSFGVVLYELLTGNYPIQGSSVASLISGHLIHPPKEFDLSDPDNMVPDEVREVVMRSLEKDPEARFGSARKMRDALDPFRKANPIPDQTLTELFEIPNLTTRKIRTIRKPGSTQSRMDESFGVATTPPPGDISDVDEDFETSGTIETDGAPVETKTQLATSQVNALLFGARKLVEAKHFDEARVQLASVIEIEPDNSEGLDLLRIVEIADVKTKQRREKAVLTVRKAIEREDFEVADTQLKKAIDAHGECELFTEAGEELEAAKRAVAERGQKLEELAGQAAAFSAEEKFEQAIERLEEGLRLDPPNTDLRRDLRVAEEALKAQAEDRKRAREIAASVETVKDHIADGDGEGAERALVVARKLYGEEPQFADLEIRIGELRHKQRLDQASELRRRARAEMKAEEFSDAIETLEEAVELAPEVEDTDALLTTAREGLQRQQQEVRRQAAIEEVRVKIDRLSAAGRYESAKRILAEGVSRISPFENAEEIGAEIATAISDRNQAEENLRAAINESLEKTAIDSFSDANELLDEAKVIVGKYPELGDWTREAETEIHRRLDAHRRQMALDNVVSSVDDQISKGTIEEARRELAVAKRLYGSSDILDNLKTKIENRERELRREEVETLIAKTLDDKLGFDEIITHLETASSIDPNNEEVKRLIVEKQASHRRMIENQIAADNHETLSEIDDLISDGETAKAIQMLDTLTAETGDFELARWLRKRLSE